jgi:glycolate oxidase subunit GlcD
MAKKATVKRTSGKAVAKKGVKAVTKKSAARAVARKPTAAKKVAAKAVAKKAPPKKTGYGKITREVLKELADIVGPDNVKSSRVDCLAYSRDMSIHEAAPDAVVFPTTTDQVAAVTKLAYRHRIPLIPRGAGTSVTGAALSPLGGILLDLMRMNRIVEINKADHYAVVEPGVVCNTLNAALGPDFFFPPDPGSAPICTIGGMISTNASGVRAVKYGTTREYVKGLRVVLADGRILDTGSTAPKTSAGYELTHFFAQSEGTLGIITRATVKISPKPEYMIFGQLNFTDIDAAGGAVEKMLTSGIPISTCEIMDSVTLDVMRNKLDIDPSIMCQLFMILDGDKDQVLSEVEAVNRVAEEFGVTSKSWTDNPAEGLKLSAARQGLVPAMSRLKPGYRLIPMVEDFGFPITKIPAVIKRIQEIGRKHDFPIATFGHIGDGNLHATFIMDPLNQSEWDTVKMICQDFIDLTIEFEGTLTAEHGEGMAKAPFIARELGLGLDLMKKVKKALDPRGILNPGKMGHEGSITDIYARSGFEKFLKKPEALKSFGLKVDNEILACIQCGFCRAGCPTFARTTLESLNARGRVTLAFNLLKGSIKPSKALAERLYQCLLCLNCKYVCPAGVDLSAIVQAARQRLAEAGFMPEVFQAVIPDMVKLGNPFGQPKETRTDSYPDGWPKKDTAETLFHVGCVGSYNDVRVVPSMMKILEAAGEDFTALGTDEKCCGLLAYLTGDIKTFNQCVDQNLKHFQALGAKNLVTTCAGCFRTYAHVYPERGFETGLTVTHAVQYIDRLIQEGRLKFKAVDGPPVKVAYHDPCDLGRHMQVFDEPRRILAALPGVELVEFPKNRNLAACCGGGGGVKAFDNPLSQEIALERVKEALGVGAEVITSACQSCKSNLNQGAALARKAKLGKVRVVDITELVVKALE